MRRLPGRTRCHWQGALSWHPGCPKELHSLCAVGAVHGTACACFLTMLRHGQNVCTCAQSQAAGGRAWMSLVGPKSSTAQKSSDVLRRHSQAGWCLLHRPPWRPWAPTWQTRGASTLVRPSHLRALGITVLGSARICDHCACPVIQHAIGSLRWNQYCKQGQDACYVCSACRAKLVG